MTGLVAKVPRVAKADGWIATPAAKIKRQAERNVVPAVVKAAKNEQSIRSAALLRQLVGTEVTTAKNQRQVKKDEKTTNRVA